MGSLNLNVHNEFLVALRVINGPDEEMEEHTFINAPEVEELAVLAVSFFQVDNLYRQAFLIKNLGESFADLIANTAWTTHDTLHIVVKPASV